MEVEQHRNVMRNRLALIVDTPEGVQFCCTQCPIKCDDKEQLEIHLCKHFKEYRFLCGICGTGLKRKEHLDRHLLGHQEVRPHECSECGKRFKRKEHLTIHRAIHSGDKNQVCPFCQRSFYRKDHLQKHLQTHSKVLEQNGVSDQCNQELIDIKHEYLEEVDAKADLYEYEQDNMMQIAEAESVPPPPFDAERPFACEVCHKTYKRRDHLKLHSLTHVEKDKICSECGKAFHKEEQLLSHMDVHLQTYSSQEDEDMVEVRNIPLGIPILPVDPQDLLLERASREARPHECPVCHRKFKRKQHLKVHANTHIKIQAPIISPPAPSIWCSLCHEGFVSNEHFESHQCLPPNCDAEGQTNNGTFDAKKENDHPETEFVDISDDAMAYINQPIISLLEESSIPTPQKVYVCKVCSKPFKRKDHYKIHLNIHTGIKSFFCPDCGKGFYRKDHLQKHEQVHQRVRKAPTAKVKKALPDLFPINMMPKPISMVPIKRAPQSTTKDVKPEITITAPSNTKLRVPLQIKVPYQMVVAMDNGEQRSVTVEPNDVIA